MRTLVFMTTGVLFAFCSTPRAATIRVPADHQRIQDAIDAAREHVYVDASTPEPGDGTKENPFHTLQDAVSEYSPSLSVGSPCIGLASDGTNMGADTGTCDSVGTSSRVVHIAPGRYSLEDVSCVHHLSLEGAGEGSTELVGGLEGLRTGAIVSDLTITGSAGEGVTIAFGENPTLRRSTITDAAQIGLMVVSASPKIVDSTIMGNAWTGVYVLGHSSPEFTNSRILANGGRAAVASRGTPMFDGCTIAGNGAGILSSNDAAPVFANCTVTENRTREEIGAVHCEERSSLILTRSIVWGNAGENLVDLAGDGVQVRFSCIQGEEVWPGEGNISDDPLFCLPGRWDDAGTPDDPADDVWAEGDYRLRPDSRCSGSGEDGGNMGADLGVCAWALARFQRGDADGDESTVITDAVYVLNFLFLGGPEPTCQKSADVDDTGRVEITDAIYLLNFLFLGGPLPGQPFGECGVDPTRDTLSCAEFPPCEEP